MHHEKVQSEDEREVEEEQENNRSQKVTEAGNHGERGKARMPCGDGNENKMLMRCIPFPLIT